MELVIPIDFVAFSNDLCEIFHQKRKKSPFFHLKSELSNLFFKTGLSQGKTGFSALKANIQAFDWCTSRVHSTNIQLMRPVFASTANTSISCILSGA